MEPIRLATQEEVETIAANSDLRPGCSVWAMGKILGVVRPVVELDPIHYFDAPDRDKLLYVWGMENVLRSQGIPAYYFNVPANEDFEKYRTIVEKLGAKRTSAQPEIRYRKPLNEH